MVKGISKQVIVLNSHDRSMFEQAIFILSDDAVKNNGITDDILMKEARRLINNPSEPSSTHKLFKFLYTLSGAVVMGLIWLLTAIM